MKDYYFLFQQLFQSSYKKIHGKIDWMKTLKESHYSSPQYFQISFNVKEFELPENILLAFTIYKIFEIVKNIRKTNNQIPIILMGYYNLILHYGIDKFTKKCALIGIDGLIIVAKGKFFNIFFSPSSLLFA